MVKLSTVRTNVDAFDDGVWKTVVRDPIGSEHMRMKIRSKLNREYQEAASSEAKRIRRQFQHTDDDPSSLDLLECKRNIVHLLVTDWVNVEDEDGQPIPFSPEACRTTLTDPAYTELFTAVDTIADNLASFEEEDAQDLKRQSD